MSEISKKMRNLLDEKGMSSSIMVFKGRALEVTFLGTEEKDNVLSEENPREEAIPVCPTEEVKEKIKNIFFDDADVEVEGLFQYKGNQLTVNMYAYSIVYKMYIYMLHQKLDIKKIEILKDEMNIYYTAGMWGPLLYDQLQYLQNYIDPEIENHDSIRVVKFNGIYRLRVAKR